jgi:hypothetical protein
MATEAMLEALSDLFVEDVPRAIEDRYPKVDRPYAELFKPSYNVVEDQLTKGYKAIHTFVTSVSGALRYDSSPYGPNMLENTTAAELIAAHQTYPGVSDIPLPGLQRREIAIAKQKGNLTMNLGMIRANKLDDAIDDYPSLVLEQTAHMMAHQAAVSFYLNDSAQVIKLNADATGVAVTRSGNAVTISLSGSPIFVEGRYRRILPGQQFDLWSADDNMTTCYTKRGWVMLDSQVDYIYPTSATFYFKNSTDATEFEAAVDAGMSNDVWLVPYSAILNRNSNGVNKSLMPCGYQSWLRKTGTLFGEFGDLTVENWGSLFRSLQKSVSAQLTESILNQYISAFQEATGVQLDSMITEHGVLNKLLDVYGLDDAGTTGSTAITRIDRTGKAEDLELGYDRIGYRYNGRIYNLYQSDFINPGELVVMKAGEGNLLRYQPPKLNNSSASPSSGDYPMFDSSIEWLGKQFSDSIWMPSRAVGGGPTDGVEAPFDCLKQHAAKEPRGIRLTDLTRLEVVGTDI